MSLSSAYYQSSRCIHNNARPWRQAINAKNCKRLITRLQMTGQHFLSQKRRPSLQIH